VASWEEIQSTILAYAIVAGVAGALVAPLLFLARSKRFLPLQRIRPAQWSGVAVLLALLPMVLTHSIAIDLLESVGYFQAIFHDAVKDQPRLRLALWASPMTLLLFLANTFLIMYAVSRTRPYQLGFSWTRWPQNCVLGYLGFLVLTPLVLGFDVLVQWLFHDVFGVEPIPHPLLELGKAQLEPIEWLLFWFQVGVTAPIMEEFYFRGIFQGWLLSRPFAQRMGGKMRARWAIGYTSLFWALVHSSWPDPIPLFVFGLALGYLAYRTQNLVPSIVVHGLFNSVSALGLYLSQ
jgi:membrane protease YdiL (CAAX protease family)